jgi:hypothetical protein
MTDRPQTSPGESLLARRARLKAERQRAAVAPAVATTAEPAAPPVTPPPKRQLTDADMPPVESLTAESDFSQFLAEGVSDALRQVALRKLFHLPAFNVVDGLNDYDDDYTKFEKLGEVVTYHQRRMRAQEEAERARAEDVAEADAQRQEAVTADQPGAAAQAAPGAADVAEPDPQPDAGTAAEAFEDDGDLTT